MRGLVLLFLIAACTSAPPARGVLEGEVAIPLTGTLRGAGELSLDSLQGTPVVVVFWASWCAPCMKEIPHFNALVQEYGDKVKVLGVNMGESEAVVYRTQKQKGMRYDSLMDVKGEIASAWRVRKLPLMLVVDKQGRIRFRGLATQHQTIVLLDSLVAG
jgi:thiol-disulfide isomerase/thioredoxin